jgi:hypothetical protein
VPTVNVFYRQEIHAARVNDFSAALKSRIARELSCGDINLSSDEVSIRLIRVFGSGMIAELEVEITAHAFRERVAQQDEICLRIRGFLQDGLSLRDIRVWLLLPELGHSWE